MHDARHQAMHPPIRSRQGPSTGRLRRRALLIGAAVALAPAFILVAGATAHSSAPVTRPAANAVVAALPRTVSITFGGRLMRVVGVQVVDRKGVNHATSARLDPRNAARVLVRTTRPAAGRYSVRWKVMAEDGHGQSGTVSFRVRP